MTSSGAPPDFVRGMRPLISELTAAEAAKSKAKDYAAAKELENCRVSLQGLVSTIETLEAKEQELVRAKQYADAEETKVQVEAAQSKLTTEEADVRDRLGALLVIKDDRAVAAAVIPQSPSAPSTETTTTVKRASWSEKMGLAWKSAVHAGSKLLGSADDDRINKLLEKANGALDAAELEKITAAAWVKRGDAEELAKSKDEGVAAAAKVALETRCVAIALLITARERLDDVIKARTAAAVALEMARRPTMQEQDVEVLRAALEAADAAGVAQPSHRLEGGAPGAEAVEGARAWLYQVRDARQRAREHVEAGLGVSAATLDVEALRVRGLEAAVLAGGVDAELQAMLTKGQGLLEKVLARRVRAVARLVAARASTVAEQDAAALEAAIGEAREAGVAQPAYRLEGALELSTTASTRLGHELVADAMTWLNAVLSARAAVTACLQAALAQPRAELDVEVLRANGVEAALVAGGVEPSLLDKGRALLAETVAARAAAVQQLRAVRSKHLAGQDVAALQAALETARESGVGQAAYEVVADEARGAISPTRGAISPVVADELPPPPPTTTTTTTPSTTTQATTVTVAEASGNKCDADEDEVSSGGKDGAAAAEVEMVVGSKPLVLRAGFDLSSVKITELPVGTYLWVLETRDGIEGTRRSRVRCCTGSGAATSAVASNGPSGSGSGSGSGASGSGGAEGYLEGWLTSLLTSGIHSLLRPEAFAALPQPGRRVLAEAERWLTEVQSARAGVRECLASALDTAPSLLDTARLEAEGVGRAAITGGIDSNELLMARTKLEMVISLRQSAVAQLRAVQAATLAEQVSVVNCLLIASSDCLSDEARGPGGAQDTAALELAIQQALESGVAQPAYRLEGGEPGERLVTAASSWLSDVQAARAAVRACLTSALTTTDTALDVDALTTHGLLGACNAGGIDLELLGAAQAKLEHVQMARANAVAELLAARAATTAEQDTAALEAALNAAQLAGVGQAAYQINGEPGLRLVRDTYAWVSQCRRAAANRKAELNAPVLQEAAEQLALLGQLEGIAKGQGREELGACISGRREKLERLTRTSERVIFDELAHLVGQTKVWGTLWIVS